VRAPALTWNEKEPDCSASIVPVESGSVIQDCVVEALHSTEAVPLFNTCNETVADEPLRRGQGDVRVQRNQTRGVRGS
jgi:hypothetical protein